MLAIQTTKVYKQMRKQVLIVMCGSRNFVRGGPTLTFLGFCYSLLMGGGGSKYHYKRAIIGPPAKRQMMAQH